MKSSFISIIILANISACVSNTDSSKDLKRNLTGDWISNSLKVEMYSVNYSEKDSVFEANALNWTEVIGIKPVITHFRPDGTYNSEHFSKRAVCFIILTANGRLRMIH
jgi:hypothetical protein